jgi:hypothetical protein
LVVGSRAENKSLFELILKLKLPFDQLIYEKGNAQGPQWIHVSYAATNRRQVLPRDIATKYKSLV